MPGKRSGGKHTPSAIPSNKTKENSPKGRSWKNKAAMIGIEIGCLVSEDHARDIFRECLTNRVLELKISAFSSYQIKLWSRDQEQCSQPLWPRKFKRIYGQQEQLDHLI